MSKFSSKPGHVGTVRSLPDIRGLVFFGTCTCGWRGANHPTVPDMPSASQRAAAEMHEHLHNVDE